MGKRGRAEGQRGHDFFWSVKQRGHHFFVGETTGSELFLASNTTGSWFFYLFKITGWEHFLAVKKLVPFMRIFSLVFEQKTYIYLWKSQNQWYCIQIFSMKTGNWHENSKLSYSCKYFLLSKNVISCSIANICKC